MKLLPVGSIVRLKGGNKMLMIYGSNVHNLTNKKDYNYVACFYPEGYMGSKYNVFFNNESIEQIYFSGYTMKAKDLHYE